MHSTPNTLVGAPLEANMPESENARQERIDAGRANMAHNMSARSLGILYLGIKEQAEKLGLTQEVEDAHYEVDAYFGSEMVSMDDDDETMLKFTLAGSLLMLSERILEVRDA